MLGSGRTVSGDHGVRKAARTALLRRGRTRPARRRRDATATARAAEAERWRRLCRRAARPGPAGTGELLAEVRRVAAAGRAQDRGTALDELLRAPPEVLARLDRAARRPAAPGTGRPALPGDADPLTLLLASFDPDGRVRRAAVERLARRGGRPAAAALALRCDDRVPQVRDGALAALLGNAVPDEAAVAVRLLIRLAARRRAGDALAAYRAALAAPGRRRVVRRLAADGDPRVRRFGVALALELGEYVRGDLARTALHDHDPVCRGLCAERLLELDPDQAGRLMWARSADVRGAAVAALPDDVPAARLVAPLADRCRTVRAQARWKLYKRGEPPVEVYRRQLRRCARTTQARLVAGLAAGLGECGDASDAPVLAVLAGDASWAPGVRRAAMRALGRVAPAEEVRRVAVPLVAGEPPGLAREALDALTAAGGAPPEALRAGLARPEPPVWRAALRATVTAEPSVRREIASRAASDPRPEVATAARTRLHPWLRPPT
ncbi:hypothetical protein SCATT_40590 [Streptantibioticus cattleyicolor NRRL 8057 = DSM 46488]|uniref:HEAT repeat domain-containing protein n=2 Tax=Streptomycetaceae TaxID=2062 RepID=F8K4R9_STREN|nr:hypothetical protein SCATT_40590 [Streptantibioticus cattleyicolor NRRL 8057 = DSM 46488]MYS60937.1 hypothetical protein [Streptomyces sp. SID5468]CCB76765.1 conserved protein of unknown function [Streptantibioticus cattleyicolor NRRL 8057 = DSM 46488]